MRQEDARGRVAALRKACFDTGERLTPLPFALSAAMVAAFTALLFLFRQELDLLEVALLYILPVFCSAFWWGQWPSYLSATISILAVDYFFLRPRYSFNIDDFDVLWSCSIFLVLSFFIGRRTEQLREETRRAQRQEASTWALYEFSREITAVFDLFSIAESMAKHAGTVSGRECLVVLPDAEKRLKIAVRFDPARDSQARVEQAPLPPQLRDVCAWVYANQRAAGRSTETMPEAAYLCVPVPVQEKIFGVFAVRLKKTFLREPERRMLSAWVRLAGVAMEKVSLAEQARQAELVLEGEKLRAALFNSVSHELRTPLAAIVGSVSVLLDFSASYSERDRLELLCNIQDSSRRMERLVANLLDSARLESGMMRIKADWCDVEDMVGTALRRMGNLAERMDIEMKVERSLPLVKADCGLVEQVLINLIDNAAKYSPDRPRITIAAQRAESGVEIAVLDRGSGVAPADLGRLFDKFYRGARGNKVAGTGLGLAICKGIIEAHGGRIWAQNRADGGLAVRFVLPK